MIISFKAVDYQDVMYTSGFVKSSVLLTARSIKLPCAIKRERERERESAEMPVQLHKGKLKVNIGHAVKYFKRFPERVVKVIN